MAASCRRRNGGGAANANNLPSMVMQIFFVIFYFTFISPALSFLIRSAQQQQQFSIGNNQELYSSLAIAPEKEGAALLPSALFDLNDNHITAISKIPSSSLVSPFGAGVVDIGPPIGAIYELTMRIPVIGQQYFQLKICNNNRAELMINGKMLKIHDQNITYSLDAQHLSFQLSELTLRTLKKFRTSLSDATYCPITDTPRITVSPPLPVKINLELKRKQ